MPRPPRPPRAPPTPTKATPGCAPSANASASVANARGCQQQRGGKLARAWHVEWERHWRVAPFGLALLAIARPGLTQTEPTATPRADGTTVPDEPPFFAHAREGIDLYRAERWAAALREFDTALALPGPDIERASLEFNAAACLFALERFAEAEERFLRAADLDPTQSTLARLNAGLAAVHTGKLDFAEAQLALAPDTEAERARHAELGAAVQRARAATAVEPEPPSPDVPPGSTPEPDLRLPAAGWHGWLAVTGGYDSNAAQSGVSETVGSTSATSSASAFVGAAASLHATHPFSSRQAARIGYTGDWLGITAAPVRDLSLQTHGIGLHYFAAVGERQLVRVGGGGELSLSGLDAVEPMLTEGFLDLRLQWDHPGPGLTRVDTRLGIARGLGDWQHLSGFNAKVEVEQRQEWEHFELGVAGGGRYFGLGTVRTTLAEGELPGCTLSPGGGPGGGGGAASDCTGATYVIPLSWAGPQVAVDLYTYPVERLALGVRSDLAYRVYLEESYLNRVPSSRKRRADTRWRGAASAELDLDRHGHVTALLEYQLLASFSNVAYDANDPEHDLDYDNRTFTQHLVETGLVLSF